MISTVSVKVGKKTHKLKVSTRAQVRLEEEQGKPIGEILDQLISGAGGVKLVSAAWAACLNDGAGVEVEEAMDVLDQLGGANAAAIYLADAMRKAFPVLDAAAGAAETEGDTPKDPVGNVESPAG
ncbi:hypothetical protein [Albibacillus kandeliae]|uniref:hypothetical protein n=1 Tax=Albibacillus kandeliae TaxID=2174228 RepID=UPI000D69789F|nr:hypothetical protein [Albibacillus kandeliae]